MTNTWYATDGTLGVTLTSTDSSANGAKFKVGTVVQGNNDSSWVYVFASAAITQYFICGVEASGTASPLDVTGARRSDRIGIAQVAFAAHDYGWIAVRGRNLTVATTGAGAVGARLYTSGTAGRVSTTAASTQAQLTDLRLVTTASGTTASTAVAVAASMIVVDPAFII